MAVVSLRHLVVIRRAAPESGLLLPALPLPLSLPAVSSSSSSSTPTQVACRLDLLPDDVQRRIWAMKLAQTLQELPPMFRSLHEWWDDAPSPVGELTDQMKLLSDVLLKDAYGIYPNDAPILLARGHAEVLAGFIGGSTWIRPFQCYSCKRLLESKHSLHNVQDLFVPRAHLRKAHERAIDKSYYNYYMERFASNGDTWTHPFSYTFLCVEEHRAALKDA